MAVAILEQVKPTGVVLVVPVTPHSPMRNEAHALEAVVRVEQHSHEPAQTVAEVAARFAATTKVSSWIWR